MLSASIGKTVGILGGGQLGKMLAEAAHRLGLKVIVLDPSADCPCHGLVDEHLLGDFKDPQQVLRLVDKQHVAFPSNASRFIYSNSCLPILVVM